MAFKMNNPMKKNFGSALNMTEAQRENLPPKLVDIIDKKEKAEGKAPTQMKKDNAPTMRLDSAAMKAMGQPAPVKMSDPMKKDDESNIPSPRIKAPSAAKDPNHPKHKQWVEENLIKYGPGSNKPYSSYEEYLEKTKNA
jgi:hypothetical protein